jgi:hypothetical protein
MRDIASRQQSAQHALFVDIRPTVASANVRRVSRLSRGGPPGQASPSAARLTGNQFPPTGNRICNPDRGLAIVPTFRRDGRRPSDLPSASRDEVADLLRAPCGVTGNSHDERHGERSYWSAHRSCTRWDAHLQRPNEGAASGHAKVCRDLESQSMQRASDGCACTDDVP